MKRGFDLKISDHILEPDKKRFYNERHFGEAASRYDRATRFMSLGQDRRWKQALIDTLPAGGQPVCVDLACGTGDVTFALAARYPGGRIIGVDLTAEMLEIARDRNRFGHVSFLQRDMCVLPLAEESVDLVTGSYALRNAPDLERALMEIHRVLRPGGTAVFLDFRKAERPALQRVQYRWLRLWCGFWGLLLHGNREIHGYIADSLRAYPSPSRLKALIREAGFEAIPTPPISRLTTELVAFRKPFPGPALRSA